jgi:tetratricopeptide (TPR) repeat protein
MERGSVREPGCAMNHRMNKTIWLVLISALLLLYLSGCSTVKNIIGWVNPWASDKTKAGVTSKDITQFVSKVRSNGGNPNSHYLLACYYQERGRHKEALEEFKKVLLIDPNYVKAYNGMGVSYDLLGDFSRAIEYYNDALKLDPNLGYVYNNLGYSYLLQGNLDDAITALKRATTIDDQDQRFHNNLALAYGEKDQYDLALSEFKLAGDEAKAHHNMAQIYFKKGLLDEAKSHYAIALKLNPSITVVRTALRAADALTRIFEPMPSKAEPRQLAMPDQPSITTAEMEKMVASEETTEQSIVAKVEIRNEINDNQSTEKDAQPIELTAMDQPDLQTIKEKEIISVDQKAQIKQLSSLKNAGIEISNGNGSHRMAKKIGDYLNEKGLKVTRLTNANNFNHSGTRIFYQKEYDGAAEHVAKQLPVFRSKEETEKFDRPNIKIKIIIGKDLIPHHKTFENGKTS